MNLHYIRMILVAGLVAAGMLAFSGCGDVCMYTVETRPCADSELREARASSKAYDDLGFSERLSDATSVEATISRVDGDTIHLSLSDRAPLAFKWHTSLEEVFAPGEAVILAQSGSWSLVSSDSRIAALFSASGDEFEDSTMPVSEANQPHVSYLAQCSTAKAEQLPCDERPSLVLLHLQPRLGGLNGGWNEPVEIGRTGRLGEWVVAHLDGSWLPRTKRFVAKTAFLWEPGSGEPDDP